MTASPVIKGYARTVDVTDAELATIQGTGKNGNVRKVDVDQYVVDRRRIDEPDVRADAEKEADDNLLAKTEETAVDIALNPEDGRENPEDMKWWEEGQEEQEPPPESEAADAVLPTETAPAERKKDWKNPMRFKRWKPERIVLRGGRKGMKVRAVRVEEVDRRRREGWSVCTSQHYSYDGRHVSAQASKGTTRTAMRYNRLVFMEIPEELLKERDEALKQRTIDQGENASAKAVAAGAVQRKPGQFGRLKQLDERPRGRRSGSFAPYWENVQGS